MTTGLLVASATVARPSLDDVYLKYTGHAFASTSFSDRCDGNEQRRRTQHDPPALAQTGLLTARQLRAFMRISRPT